MCGQHLSFKISFTELRPFLKHWSSRYKDANDQMLYDPYIGTADLKTDESALIELFKWKNVGELSKKKSATIRANYFDRWTEDADLEARYLDPNQGNGPIWNIFYLHCRFPERYPIYDQHAHRAMIYMQEGAICEERDDLDRKPRPFVYESYKRYRRFVEIIGRATDGDLRTIDRALYTFGQFLKRARPYR
jgi:hypothetical protein